MVRVGSRFFPSFSEVSLWGWGLPSNDRTSEIYSTLSCVYPAALRAEMISAM